MFLDSAYYIKEKAFSSSFCDDIMKQGYKKKLEMAKISDGNQVNRKSHVSWLDDKTLVEQITPVINEARPPLNKPFSVVLNNSGCFPILGST